MSQGGYMQSGSIENQSKCLFSWDNFTENDSKKFKEYLKLKLFCIKWIKEANIKKNEDDNTIIVTETSPETSIKTSTKTSPEPSPETKSLLFELKELNDKEQTQKVVLKIEGGIADEFVVKMEDGKRNIYHQEPPRPKAKSWFFDWHILGFQTKSYENWKRDAEAFFRYDYFESDTPINTPLEWTKTMLQDSYKISSGNYQQIIVLLATAFLSAGLWGGLIVKPNTSSINFTTLGIFIGLIAFSSAYETIRWKFKHAINDAKMTVVLEHKCTPCCKDLHFPPSAKSESSQK